MAFTAHKQTARVWEARAQRICLIRQVAHSRSAPFFGRSRE